MLLVALASAGGGLKGAYSLPLLLAVGEEVSKEQVENVIKTFDKGKTTRQLKP